MAHRVAPSAERDLDDLWYFVAKEAGSVEIANRLIDSITNRFSSVGELPVYGAVLGMKTSASAAAAFPLEST